MPEHSESPPGEPSKIPFTDQSSADFINSSLANFISFHEDGAVNNIEDYLLFLESQAKLKKDPRLDAPST